MIQGHHFEDIQICKELREPAFVGSREEQVVDGLSYPDAFHPTQHHPVQQDFDAFLGCGRHVSV
jgi:hypothetical protein